jgi:hypothetical protein
VKAFNNPFWVFKQWYQQEKKKEKLCQAQVKLEHAKRDLPSIKNYVSSLC